MKVLPIEKVREADAYTIENEPIKSIDLMERAAAQCYKWIKTRIDKKKNLRIIVGPGNNGGDGLVIARMFAKSKINIQVIILRFTDNESKDFSVNLKRLRNIKSVDVVELRDSDKIPEFSKDDLIIDAVFGSGLSKPVKGFIASVFEEINKSTALVIAIDMPSGLFADKCSKDIDTTIIRADYTLSIQFPKLAFFFPENDQYIGNWEIVPIGLHPEYINRVDVKNFYLEKRDLSPILKNRNKFDHKGTFGHALIIAGSYGKAGAAVLASQAAIRAGAGLVSCHIPKLAYNILQTAVPEVMINVDESDEVFSSQPEISPFNAIAIGPGLGTAEETQKALKLLIQNNSLPMIFDADALNILAENKTWLSFLPKESILTPHPGEFKRLVGSWENDFEKYELQKEFSFKNQCILILKGAYTSVSTPDGRVFFNSTGNPGMATAGSGDVLTGILLGLLAQNNTPLQTALLGVYLHGLAGDIAAKRQSQEAMIAVDIIFNLGNAFKRLRK